VTPRRSALLAAALTMVAAIAIGVIAGFAIARRPVASGARVTTASASTLDFTPAAPPSVGVPTTPVPIPSERAPLAIAFLDERTKVALARRVVRAKVGECVVARLQPQGANAYRRLVGGERWHAAGDPSVEVRPGDAPGYCLTWNAPSGPQGYALDASAVVADDAGTQALGQGRARVVVRGTPKPRPASPSRPVAPRRTAPQPQASANDQ